MQVIIQYTKKAWKERNALTQDEQDILAVLEEDMRQTNGKPLGRGWQHLGPVRQYSTNAYHCHLSRNTVAQWTIDHDKDGTVKITVCTFEYVGPRSKAPY